MNIHEPSREGSTNQMHLDNNFMVYKSGTHFVHGKTNESIGDNPMFTLMSA